ncbi:ComF family protein [Mesonia hippocampi]|uniref:ComF family protein n=1 Tax=Mesonia hippocampi TaxID=1628250 RepID=A0A840ENW1_9FLAO|nr:phosphoribosyltransferase family protein [Mesonia hippocampi]MBB4118283.1 ComF family protein [Mesonia hippocampi]
MLTDLFSLFFPRICACCQQTLARSERILCVTCKHQMPVTNMHQQNENMIKKVFSGRLPIENSFALLYFSKKGNVQKILHQLKYKGREEISDYLGKWTCFYLKQQKWITEIDAIIPVPLHRKKRKKRGYNQVDGFGKSIAQTFNIPYLTQHLVKKTPSRTQVFKNRLGRAELNKATFYLKNIRDLQGKHILLVDDIITTGTTIENCGKILKTAKNSKLSVASMALTV